MNDIYHLGDKVEYYDRTYMRVMVGTITALNIPIRWLWDKEKSMHPVGLEVNGSLTLPYTAVSKLMTPTSTYDSIWAQINKTLY